MLTERRTAPARMLPAAPLERESQAARQKESRHADSGIRKCDSSPCCNIGNCTALVPIGRSCTAAVLPIHNIIQCDATCSMTLTHYYNAFGEQHGHHRGQVAGGRGARASVLCSAVPVNSSLVMQMLDSYRNPHYPSRAVPCHRPTLCIASALALPVAGNLV